MIYETYVLPPCEKIPQQAAYSAIRNFTQNYDPTPAAEACKIPMAYISADVLLVNMARDLNRLQELCPKLSSEDDARWTFQHDRSRRPGQRHARSVPGRRPRPVQGLMQKLT